MLNEAKTALEVQTVTAYDAEIAALCQSAAMDLTSVGVLLPGTVDLIVATDGTVTDASTLRDPYVMRAIITYVKAHFRNPPDREGLLSMYDYQKKKLANTNQYAMWGESECTKHP